MLYFCYRFNIIWWNKSIDSLVNYFFHSNWQSISNSTFQDSLRSLVRLRLEGVFLQTLSGCWLWFRFDFNFKLSRLAFLTVKKMHTEHNAPFLQLFPHKQPLPHPTTTWTDRQTHKLHTKRITPLPYAGTGGIFCQPHFSISLKCSQSEIS